MIRFGTGLGGILALIITIAIIYCIHFGIIMVLWKWLMVGIFDLPMINFGQTIGLWFLFNFLTNSPGVKATIIKPKVKIKEEDLDI